MLIKEAERDRLEPGLDRRNLRQDVDAVAVLLDHLFDAANLAFDATQALAELVFVRDISGGGHWSALSVSFADRREVKFSENAIAAPASMGFSKPAAASGRAAML